MDAKRFTGAHAGSQKYDLLTAMAIAGLNGSSGFQTSMLRLVALVTARYNWKLDEFSVGQRDLARMWSVDERTVKREIKRLTQAQVLLQLRPGVRGRVAAYRLNQPEILRLSAPHWTQVGPDFAARMDAAAPEPEAAAEKVVRVDFRTRSPAESDLRWIRTVANLASQDASLHRNWFSQLSFSSHMEGRLHLKAASSFVAQYVSTHLLRVLFDAALPEFPDLHRIMIQAD